jgi:hypothetical protein
MNIEITEELFNLIVPSGTEFHSIADSEDTYIIYYLVEGVRLYTLSDYDTGKTKHYIEDVNS